MFAGKTQKDSKAIWKILNEELGKKFKIFVINGVIENNILIENEKDICNVFNTFFINVGADIKNNITTNGFEEMPWNYLNNNCEINDTLFINPINQIELEQHIDKIKDKMSFFRI